MNILEQFHYLTASSILPVDWAKQSEAAQFNELQLYNV